MFNQKIKLNVDKLELTYSMPNEFRLILGERDYWQCGEYGDVELHRTENRHYKNQFSIQVGGIIIGEIFFDPLNRFRQKIYVSVRNERLYDGWTLGGITYIEQALGLNFERISKLHICFDTNTNIVNQFYRILHDTKEYGLIVNNRVVKDDEELEDILHISTGTRRNTRKHKSPLVKDKEHSIELAFYDKTHELTATEKDYIPSAVGFSKIWRLEARMNDSRAVKNILEKAHIDDTEMYMSLFDEAYLFRAFMSAMDRVIRVKKGKRTLNLLETIYNQ